LATSRLGTPPSALYRIPDRGRHAGSPTGPDGRETPPETKKVPRTTWFSDMWEGRWAGSREYYFYGPVISISGPSPSPHFRHGKIYIIYIYIYIYIYILAQDLPPQLPNPVAPIYISAPSGPPPTHLARKPAHRPLQIHQPLGSVPENCPWPTPAAPVRIRHQLSDISHQLSNKPPTGNEGEDQSYPLMASAP
jgi:hypothetical protein